MPLGRYLQQEIGGIIRKIYVGDSGLLHCGGSPSKIPVAWVSGSDHLGVGVL